MDLRANTAVDVLIGPFVDKTDGNTTKDSLTLTQAEIKLSKLGQPLAQKNDATSAAFDDDGYYNCELDATDTDTEGNLVLIVHQSANALPVRHEFNVMAEAAWDSLYIAKDDGFMDVNIKTVGRTDTQETEADNLESACSSWSATRGLAGTALPAAVVDADGGLETGTTRGTNAGQWYVSKSASDDTGDGRSWATAKLTISASLTAAAIGDTHHIGPGDYPEAITIAKADTTLVGAGKYATRIHDANIATTISAVRVTLMNLSSESTGTSIISIGIQATAQDQLTLINVRALGASDGLNANATSRVYATDCDIEEVIVVSGHLNCIATLPHVRQYVIRCNNKRPATLFVNLVLFLRIKYRPAYPQNKPAIREFWFIIFVDYLCGPLPVFSKRFFGYRVEE